MQSADREKVVSELCTRLNSAGPADAPVPFSEVWPVIESCGFDVLFDFLVGTPCTNGKRNSRPFGNRSYAELYSITFAICSNPFMDSAADLYQHVDLKVRAFLTDRIVAPLLNPDLVGPQLVVAFSQAWEHSKKLAKWVRSLFMHLDNNYIVTQDALPTLTGLCMHLFRDVAYFDTREKVVSAALNLIEDERSGGDKVDREQLKSCLQVFLVVGGCERQTCMHLKSVEELLKRDHDLSLYIHDFEAAFLDRSRKYYEAKAAIWREDPVPVYLQRCEEALNFEKDLAARYLHNHTEPMLKACLENYLLAELQLELIHHPTSGMLVLLQDNRRDDLRRMFQLFMRDSVPLKEGPMAEVFESFVSQEGAKALSARKAELAVDDAAGKKEAALDGSSLVLAMLRIYAHCEGMVTELFARNLNFQKALQAALQKFINDDASKKVTNVEVLVAYVDRVLQGKEGNEKLDEQGIQERLDGTFRLFEFVVDKDVYQALYRDALSKRLLNNKSSSLDMEKHMITQFKLSQGPPFTRNFEGMLMDFALADSIDEEYQTFCREEGTSREMGALESDQGSIANPLLASSSSSSSSGAPAIRSKVQQLTVGFWPTGAAIEGLILPGPFKRITTSFERYFHNKHNDKKGLHWKHALGDAEVSGYFPKIRKSYTMVVTTLQAMALIYMSERHSMSASSSDSSENVEKLTVAELQTGLSLDVEIVKRVVHSLACGKFKVLLKTGPGGSKKVDSTDEFWPNRDFTSPKIRFSIPMASLDFANSIKSKAVEDRSFAIDACIVRTMKARKRMGHSALIAEVMQQLTTFKPDSTTVKKRVEALIDREFLARHEDSGGSWTREYDYLA